MQLSSQATSPQLCAIGIYQHYKGYYYEVIEVARHSETLEQLVVYRALYDDFALWVRPLDMFLEDVEIEGKKRARFAFVSTQKAAEFLKSIEK